MRGPLMVVLVSGPLTPMGKDNTQADSSADTRFHTGPQITEIDRKLRLIISWEKLSTYQILNYRWLHESVPCVECWAG